MLLMKSEINKKLMFQDRLITLTLNIIISSLSANRKNHLYLIVDAIVEHLRARGEINKQDGTVGNEVSRYKGFEQIWEKCRQSPKMANYLKDTLLTLFQNIQEKDIKFMNESYSTFYKECQSEKLKM